GAGEEDAALLQVKERVGVGLALLLHDEDAVGAAAQRARVGAVLGELVVKDAGPARVGHELRPVTDEAAGRDGVLHAHAPLARRVHLVHAPAAPAELLDDGARVGLLDVDDDVLVGLGATVRRVVLEDDLRLRDAELVALAAHGLDEDRQVELAAAGDL